MNKIKLVPFNVNEDLIQDCILRFDSVEAAKRITNLISDITKYYQRSIDRHYAIEEVNKAVTDILIMWAKDKAK